MKYIFFYHISESILATFIQRYDKKSFQFKNEESSNWFRHLFDSDSDGMLFEALLFLTK